MGIINTFSIVEIKGLNVKQICEAYRWSRKDKIFFQRWNVNTIKFFIWSNNYIFS
jgi:hypothetical protein